MSNQDLKFKMFEVKPDQDRDQLDNECANLELDLIAKNLNKQFILKDFYIKVLFLLIII